MGIRKGERDKKICIRMMMPLMITITIFGPPTHLMAASAAVSSQEMMTHDVSCQMMMPDAKRLLPWEFLLLFIQKKNFLKVQKTNKKDDVVSL